MSHHIPTEGRRAVQKCTSFLLFLLWAGVAMGAPEGMRLEERMLFRAPELAKPGACVMYREGGAGWILTEPVYWLKGTTLASEVRKRRVERCPEVAGKAPEQYSRAEFNRWARAQPCLSGTEKARDEDFGVVRLRIEDWETPWAKRMASAGRLHQGHYLDAPLKKGGELEIDAALLEACR